MFKRGSTSKCSSAAQADFLHLCKVDVKSIEGVVAGGALLNGRQCEDLSSKLSQTISNIRELVNCGASSVFFGPALENLYRHVEKAKALVSECAKKNRCAAAVFQCENENAFREILLDVSFCYNVIYELAKSKRKDWWHPPEDLRKSSILLEVASVSDVDEDKKDLKQELEEVANAQGKRARWSKKQPIRATRSLASYLLVKMSWKSEESTARALEVHNAVMWSKAWEVEGTWGRAELLAHSNSAAVHKTKWLGIPCAKKEFRLAQGIQESFRKEAGIFARLKHPCIVDFICCGNGQVRETEKPFICMELMEMDLLGLIEEHAKEGKYFSVGEALDIMVQMARGVCYLHGEGVAHRDLKPGNVVLKKLSNPANVDHYLVKLVDFGISKSEIEALQSATMTANFIGTTYYRAPELHAKANPNPNALARVNWMKADAFSFGMTCAHLLCCKRPYEDTKPLELYDEVTKRGKRPTIPEIYPEELIQLLAECWNSRPHLRPSFVDICVRLEKICFKSNMGCYSTTLPRPLENDEHVPSEGVDFINLRFNTLIKLPTDGDQDESNNKDYVSIITCICGCALQLLPQPPYKGGVAYCNVCWQKIYKEVYHCEACQFDAHTHCVEIKDQVEESFHPHTLHLLIEDYYMDKPDVICCLCEESMQHSKWVYRCEQCDIDVHALCSKLQEKFGYKRLHEHVMTMIQCPPRKSFTCTCCNGEVKDRTWHYVCSIQGCGVHMHLRCTIIQQSPLCIFGTSHRFNLVTRHKSFYCARCSTLGRLWSYHCNTCDVDIHLDCLDNMDGVKEVKWIRAFETFMFGNENQDHYMKMIMLSELVDKVPMSNALEGGSSSTSHLQQVLPSIQRPTSEQQLSLEALDNDANLQKEIATQTTERMKAKKLTVEEARQKLSTNLLEMLEKLEKSIMDLHSSWSNMSEDEAQSLATTHKKLTKRQDLVKDQMAMQVQSRMNQAPHIAVFGKLRRKLGKWVLNIINSFQASMEGVLYFVLLCEEPGHEHVCSDKFRIYYKKLLAEKLQALVAGGLEVVRRVLSTLQPHQLKSGLRSVIVPCLGSDRWDLRAMEEVGNRSMDECEDAEKVEVLKCVEDSAAQWFREYLENDGLSMLKTFGLQRVRYTVTSGEDEVWKHRRGKVAWVCKEHVESGLKGGTLELLPWKYYNA